MASLHYLKKDDEREGMIQLFQDIIDTCVSKGDLVTAQKHIDTLWNKYGVKYVDQSKKVHDPALHYDLADFVSFDQYRWYCDARYSWKYKHLNLASHDHPLIDASKQISPAQETFLRERLDVTLLVKDHVSGTESAFVSGKDEIFLSRAKLDHARTIGVIVHELGHVYDNRHLRGQQGIAGDMAEACSAYGTMNSGECFAETFMHYFLNPSWLAACSPEVFARMPRTINAEWRSAIKQFLTL